MAALVHDGDWCRSVPAFLLAEMKLPVVRGSVVIR